MKNKDSEQETTEFTWKSELKQSEIPDLPIKGLLNGKPFDFRYINFEQWRGSGDNVINFYENAPKNDCGYVEGGRAIHFLHKAGTIDTGKIFKASFEKSIDGFIAYYDTTGALNESVSGSMPWNCSLEITEINEKTVKGKIVICFKDEKKSYLAGKFEAVRCYN